MKHSDTLGELFKALNKAQAEIKPAIKDATNPHLRSKYADLGSIWEACRNALAQNGLSVSQWPADAEPGFLALTTVLGHSSGEYIMETYRLPLTKNDAQSVGSATTYAKRYALAAVMGVVGADDDDGHAASAPKAQQKAQQAAARPTAPAPATPAGKLSAEKAQSLHKQLGMMLQETRYREMTHNAFAAQIIGREVKSLTDLTPAESREVYSAAQVAQQESAA